jgi:hypothetical protein
MSGSPNLTVIDAVTQFVGGTQAVWNSILIPVPLGMVVYAVDTTVLKMGDGVTLYSALPVLLTLNELTTFVSQMAVLDASGVVTTVEMTTAISTAITAAVAALPAREWGAGTVNSVVGATLAGGVLTIAGGSGSGEWTAGPVSSVVGATLAGGVLTVTGGISVASASVTGGTLTLTLSNGGTIVVTGDLTGPPGTPGAPGTNGAPGVNTSVVTTQGAVGTYAQYNAAGQFGIGNAFAGPIVTDGSGSAWISNAVSTTSTNIPYAIDPFSYNNIGPIVIGTVPLSGTWVSVSAQYNPGVISWYDTGDGYDGYTSSQPSTNMIILRIA